MSTGVKFSISGLRGVWGEGLTEDVCRENLEAFAIFLQKRGAKKILLARDTRVSGSIIKNIAIEVLTGAGFEITDIDIAPTPTLIFLVRNMPFDGGVMISASHNPKEYNGLKFFTSSAMYINEAELEEIKSYLGKTVEQKDGGIVKENKNLGKKHVEHIIKNVDRDLIRGKKFKVVLDVINGAGYELAPMLLRELWCDVIVINGEPNGDFAHVPEPLAENLVGLGEKVRGVTADVGFAEDPDADRLVLCDEHGEIVFEEYTLSLSIEAVLSKGPGDIVTNLSTSNTNEDLVQKVGGKNFRTKVGEGNVVEGIIEHHAVIGGEGSGGVIYPKINLCRDSLVAMALTLEYMAKVDEPLSKIIMDLPKYYSVKKKKPFIGSLNEIFEKVVGALPDGRADYRDGLRIDFKDRSWVQIRESNTEPIVRIWSEAKTKDRAEELVEAVIKRI